MLMTCTGSAVFADQQTNEEFVEEIVTEENSESLVQLETTKAFIDTTETWGFSCVPLGSYDGEEVVYLPCGTDDFEDIDFVFCFDEDGDYYSIYAYINTEFSADANTIYEVLNGLNQTYRFVKFYYDSDDASITISNNVSQMGVTDVGGNAFDMFYQMYTILEDEDVVSQLNALK